MKIKDLPKIDMPREKLEKYGPEKLSDHELLAILLGSGIKGLNVLELSKKILKNISKVGIDKVTLKDLLEIKGLGKAKASEIISCFELGRRVLKDKKTSILLSAKDVWERMSEIRTSKKEHFVVFYLDGILCAKRFANGFGNIPCLTRLTLPRPNTGYGSWPCCI